MNEIYLGKIVNTHGIKGEIRLLSDFEYKDQVFKKGFPIYIGKERNKELIATYRKHKIFDMIKVEGINDINDILKYKGKAVYIDRNDLKIDNYLDEDLIGFSVITDKTIGKVVDIIKRPYQKIIKISVDNKQYMIPFVDEFVKEIDLKNKQIKIHTIEGLIYEN